LLGRASAFKPIREDEQYIASPAVLFGYAITSVLPSAQMEPSPSLWLQEPTPAPGQRQVVPDVILRIGTHSQRISDSGCMAMAFCSSSRAPALRENGVENTMNLLVRISINMVFLIEDFCR